MALRRWQRLRSRSAWRRLCSDGQVGTLLEVIFAARPAGDMLPANFHSSSMNLRNAVCLFAPALLLCGSCRLIAQKNAACGAPPVVPPDSRPNYFSEQQEEWLGE